MPRINFMRVEEGLRYMIGSMKVVTPRVTDDLVYYTDLDECKQRIMVRSEFLERAHIQSLRGITLVNGWCGCIAQICLGPRGSGSQVQTHCTPEAQSAT